VELPPSSFLRASARGIVARGAITASFLLQRLFLIFAASSA
jgi:hypothetical protein